MKKSMKRTLSLLLALTMVLSLGLPAYAVGAPAEDAVVIADEQPVELPAEEPVEEPAEEPVEEPIEEPVEKPVTLPIGAGKKIGFTEEEEIVSEDLIVDVVSEESVVEEEAAPAKDFSYSESATGFSVEVSAPAGALPLGTEMVVDRLVDLSSVQNAVDRAENLNGSVQLAADISFWLNGEEIEPAEGTKLFVRMSAPEIEGIADPIVIHVPDGENAVPEIVEQMSAGDIAMADAVSFEASSFSVYAVIEDNNTGDEARVTVNFYNTLTSTTDPVVTVYVKNSDVLLADGADKQDGVSYINDIVYDPGVGETLGNGMMFKGWSMDVSKLTNQPADADKYVGKDYQNDTEGMTIPEIRTFLEALEIKEGDVLDIYAMIYNVYNATYEDAKGVVLASDVVLMSINETTVDYKIEHNYDPMSSTEHFDGWNVVEGASNIVDPSVAEPPYPMGTTMKLKGNVKFSTEVSKGAWLVFEENGYNATYNAPVFVKQGEKPADIRPSLSQPEEMKRPGYTFVNWYVLKEGIDISTVDKDGDDYVIDDENFEEFNWNNTLTDKVTVYAKWTASATAKYTVVVWKQSVVDDKAAVDADKTYDFAFSEEVNDIESNKAVSALDLSRYNNLNGGSITVNGKDYSFVGFKLNTTMTAKQGSGNVTIGNGVVANRDKVTPDGTTVVNLYYDRELVTYNYYISHTGAGYTVDNNWGSYGLVNGVYVYLGNDWWNDAYYYLTNSDGTPIPANTTVYYRSGNRWRSTTEPGYDTQYYATQNTSDTLTWKSYSGDRYSYSNSGVTVWELDSSRTQTGLYGQKLSKYGYTWSTDYRWYTEDPNNPGNPSESNFTSIEEMFLGSRNFYGRTQNFNAYVYHILQNVDGSWPNSATYTVATNTNSYMSFKSFAGFSSYQFRIKIANSATNYWYGEYSSFNNSYPYRTDSNGWTDWLDPGNAVISQNYNSVYTNDTSTSGELWHATTGGIQMRYTRDEFNLTYMVGRFLNRNNEALTPLLTGQLKQVSEIAYEASLSDYAKTGTKYFNPDEDESIGPQTGFMFAGWYLDETCTTEAKFDGTMPLNGYTVYGKWQQTEYRVFLKPNALIDGVRDTTLDWGSETQATNFRISYNNKVSLPTGTRTGYEFGGWFTDEECMHPYAPDTRLTDSTVPTDPAYDKTVDFTDGENDVQMDKWGLIPDGVQGINKDVNRPWIERKLVLYARWSKLIPGAEGIGVYYDGNGGTNVPSDTLKYKDNIYAVAQAASTAPSDDLTFDCWVMQRWDEAQSKFVDIEGSRIYPGDKYLVLLDNAQATQVEYELDGEGNPKLDPNGNPIIKSAVYTIHLRAEYVNKEAPTPTYITWFSNVYDAAGNKIPEAQTKTTPKTPTYVDETGATKNYDTVAFDADKGYGFTRQEVQINAGIEIPAADTFTMEGYKFIGWGRIDKGTTRGASGVTDPSKLDDTNLFLKWVVDDENTGAGHYEAKDTRDGAKADTWVTVTKVAADEDNPYQDLYAVWSGEFYVVHTGVDYGTDGKPVTETYYINRGNNEFNLLKKHQPVGASTTSVEATNESSITPNYLYGGYYLTASSTDGKAYNGSNWTFSDSQTVDASRIHPVGGTTYYIKEVPGNVGKLDNPKFKDYLAPKISYTYYKDTNLEFDKIGSVFLVSMIDDAVGTAYKETGFIIDGTRYKADTIKNLTIEALDDSANPKANNEYSASGTNGLISYLLVFDRPDRNGEPDTEKTILKNNQSVQQYWITNDGYLVVGYTTRVYTNLDASGTKPSTMIASFETKYTDPVLATP